MSAVDAGTMAAAEAGPGRGSGVRNAVVLIAALLALWQGLHLWIGDIAIASPAATVRYAIGLFGSERFLPHLVETAKAFVAGYALAIVLGLGIGFWLGFSRVSGEVLEPMVVAVYSLPKVTLYPILLLAFGLGISAKIAFGTLHGMIPIILFTLGAVRGVRPVLVKTGRVLKLTPVQLVRSILFPAALPEIFTGLRVGFSLTLIGVLLAEMFASQRGLGYLLDERHRAAQRRADHGDHAPHRRVRGEREHAAAPHRPAAARARVASWVARQFGSLRRNTAAFWTLPFCVAPAAALAAGAANTRTLTPRTSNELCVVVTYITYIPGSCSAKPSGRCWLTSPRKNRLVVGVGIR